MLPKTHHLNLSHLEPNKPFLGTKLHTPHLTLVYHSNSTHLHLGVIVSKKISPKAVIRNLVKRRLINATSKLISLNTPIDLLIIPHPTIGGLTYQQLYQELVEIAPHLNTK